jgi:hypothetical protein
MRERECFNSREKKQRKRNGGITERKKETFYAMQGHYEGGFRFNF